MIARVWHGRTKPEDADAYRRFLSDDLFPAVGDRVGGFRGGYVFRRQDGNGTEFLVMTLFESLDDVRAFAGDDIGLPVVEPEAKRLLIQGDARASHYDVR